MTAQSAAFNSKQQYRHNSNTNSQSASYVQIASSVREHERNYETGNVSNQSTDLQILFDVIKQIEKIIEPYRANVSETFDIVKKVLHGHHAAYFSCAILQLNLKTMQYWSGELQSALTTLVKKVFKSNLPSKI